MTNSPIACGWSLGSAPGGADAPGIRAAAERALALVQPGMRVGLGSGRAASAFIELLGERCRGGLDVRGVATSQATARLARKCGVPLLEADGVKGLDLTVDGADEVAPNLDLVKGWGGALVRERIVAAASRRQVIVVGPEKLVERIGERGRVPVEIIPLAQALAAERIRELGCSSSLRVEGKGREPLVTDNGNLILDVAPRAPLADGAAARQFEAALLAIPGVVDTGLFLGTADAVLVGHPDGRVEELRRPST
jgi:ribose 5-phosphate isomerase A